MRETEVKILEVKPALIRRLLRKHEARFVRKVFQRSCFYQSPGTRAGGITVRLRTEGRKAVLTVKGRSRILRGHKIREEHELEVHNLATAEAMLKLLGMRKHAHTEAKREYWLIDGCSVEIIKLPGIPYYIEIEGSETGILRAARRLGFSEKDYFAGGIGSLYRIKPFISFSKA